MIAATPRFARGWRRPLRSRPAVVAVITAASLVFAAFASTVFAGPQGEGATGQSGQAASGLGALDQALRKVVANVGPSIVTVVATHRMRDRASSDKAGKGAAREPEFRSYTTSGIVMDPHGHIVAAADPITESCMISVVTESPKGDIVQYTAALVGRSHADNVAVIRLLSPPKWLWPIQTGRADRLGPGSMVFALSRHYKLPVSCSLGFMTGFNRSVQTKQRNLSGLMMTSGVAGQGDVGGAIVGADGRAVAMLMSTYDGFSELYEMTAEDEAARGKRNSAADELRELSTIKFSMPIDRVLTVANQLIVQHQSRSEPAKNEMWKFLGVRGEYLLGQNALSSQLGLKSGYGFLVLELFENEAAARGKIRVHDIILELGGHDISYKKYPLGKAIKNAPRGQPVSVLLIRGGRRMRTSVTFRPFPATERLKLKSRLEWKAKKDRD